MGLFRRDKKDGVLDGLPGSAVVVHMGDAQYLHTDRDDEHLSDYGIGSVRYPLELEVTVAGGTAPYKVVGVFKVPARITGVAEGVTLPLHVDPSDPKKVEIDWASFIPPADPPAITPHDIHAGFPDASRQAMVDGWVTATNGGQMTRKQFDKAIDGALGGGLLTQAEADAARASFS